MYVIKYAFYAYFEFFIRKKLKKLYLNTIPWKKVTLTKAMGRFTNNQKFAENYLKNRKKGNIKIKLNCFLPKSTTGYVFHLILKQLISFFN